MDLEDQLRAALLGYVVDASVEIPCVDRFGHYWWRVSAVDHLGLQLRHDCADWDLPGRADTAKTLIVNIPAVWLRESNYGSLLGAEVGTIVTTVSLQPAPDPDRKAGSLM